MTGTPEVARVDLVTLNWVPEVALGGIFWAPQLEEAEQRTPSQP
jgi:hypothetical protein